MKGRRVLMWMTVVLCMVSLTFVVSCTKDAFRETPGAPQFDDDRLSAAEEDVEVEAVEVVEGTEPLVMEEEDEEAEILDEEPEDTEVDEEALLRERALLEQEEQERAEQERLAREQEEQARLAREQLEREMREAEEEQTQAFVMEEREKVESESVYFEFDSAVLSESSKETLRRNARFLINNTNFHVIVEGHCDERGSVEYNLALGQRRAENAQRYLVLLGVELERTQTISYGSERPADPRHNEEAWALNRRCDFVLDER